MSESTSSSASSVVDPGEPHGHHEDIPMALECQTGSSLAEPSIPGSIPPHPPDMRSIIRRLRRQDLQLQSTHLPPGSPPSDGETSVTGSSMDCRDEYQEGRQGTKECTSDASSSTLFPKWIKQQDVKIDLDAGQMSSSRGQGIVEYTVRSADLAPTCSTAPASSSYGGSLTPMNGPGVLAADTCEPGTEVEDKASLLPSKYGLAADLAAELPAGGLQAMMIHAKLRASLPRLASGVNRKDLVRFHLSDEVAQHCSSRVLNRVYKPPRTRVRGKVPARKPTATSSGSSEAASAARPTSSGETGRPADP